MAVAPVVAQDATPVHHGGNARGASHRVSVCLVVVSLFLSQTVTGFYIGLGQPAPYAWSFLSMLSISMSVLAWFWSYSRYHRIGWVLDMAWFVLSAWIVIVPYYLLKREGRRGLARIGLFCLIYFAAWATGLAVRIWVRVLTS